MLTHAQIWGALDRLAARADLSASGLAKKAGLDPTTFNKSKRITPDGRPRWPSTEFGFEVAGRYRLQRRSLRATDRRQGEADGQGGAADRLRRGRRRRIFRRRRLSGRKGLDEIPFPAVNDEHAYALEISGNSMEPAYRDGTIILISPAASIRRGDRVVVKTREGEVTVKELKRRTAKTVELRSVNADHGDRSLPVRDVEWIARVMWASQ